MPEFKKPPEHNLGTIASMAKKSKENAQLSHNDDNEPLFRMRSCQNTKKLLELIPRAEVQNILDEYAVWSGLEGQDSSKQFVTNSEEKGLYSLKKELSSIKKTLEEISWFSEKDRQDVLKSLLIKLASTETGRKYVISFFIKSKFKTGGRRREKPFLDFLVVGLVELMKERTGKPRYKLIARFLYEQGIIESTDEIAFSRRFERAAESLDDVGETIVDIQKLRLLKITLRLISSKNEKYLPVWFMNLLMEAFNFT